MEKGKKMYYEALKSGKRRKCCADNFWGSSVSLRCMLVISCVLIVSASIVLAVYFLLIRKEVEISAVRSETWINQEIPETWYPSCPEGPVPDVERYDCYPEDHNVTPLMCAARGCCWITDHDHHLKEHRVPKCTYPGNYGYRINGKVSGTYNGFIVPLTRLPMPSRFGDDIQEVHVQVEMQTQYRLRIKFFDPNSERYEVPAPRIPVDPDESAQKEREMLLYSVAYTTQMDVPFSIKVRRLDSDAIIFDTSPGGLTISHHFLELTSLLPSSLLYGLGEHIRGQLRHDMQWQTWSMFSDPAPEKGVNMQGAHPMYMCIEDDGKAHGVLLLNSNAMEVNLQPSPAITFRTIGGILDFYIFLGPTPEDVVKQYTEAVGRPAMPPYWALGLHLGRQGFYSIEDVHFFLNGMRKKNISMEVLHLDADVLQRFSLSDQMFSALPNLTSQVHSYGQKLLLAIQAGVRANHPPTRDPAYNIGLQQKVFITDKWGLKPLFGKRNTDDIAYPDFGSSSCLTWWADVLYRISVDTKFDGLWMTNNEPASDADDGRNGCLNDDLNRPPYVPKIKGKTLYSRTVCMDATQHWKDYPHTHYNLHNLYGHSMALATEYALKSYGHTVRKLLLSRSTFVGSGKYVGHWIEGIKGTWSGMSASLPAVMEFGLFGIPFVGANICGDNGGKREDSDSEELCLRWIQLGMFYPFSRMYSSAAGKICEAGKYSHEFFHSTRYAIELRYKLLPYLYHLFFLAHTEGSTVMRPLFHEFPADNKTYNITKQFMWGPALMIAPVLEKSAEHVEIYIPEGLWYDFYSGKSFLSKGKWVKKTVPHFSAKQPVFLNIRAGHMIPLQKPSMTTAESRRNPLQLLVALNSTFQAHGTLFWDDGETKDSYALGEFILVDFVVTENTLTVTGRKGKKSFMSNFDNIYITQVTIMGVEQTPRRITIDGSYLLSKKQYHWNIQTKVLQLKEIFITLERTQIRWH